MTGARTDRSTLLARRARLLAPTHPLFYEQPLQIVRAEGVWMYDEQGRRYLDAYNNVPAVGHCHPAVVRAICEQARILNTHTRYLTEEPLQLAEELLATLPPDAFSAHLGRDLGEFPSSCQPRKARCGMPSNSRTCCCRGVRSASKV